MREYIREWFFAEVKWIFVARSRWMDGMEMESASRCGMWVLRKSDYYQLIINER